MRQDTSSAHLRAWGAARDRGRDKPIILRRRARCRCRGRSRSRAGASYSPRARTRISDSPFESARASERLSRVHRGCEFAPCPCPCPGGESVQKSHCGVPTARSPVLFVPRELDLELAGVVVKLDDGSGDGGKAEPRVVWIALVS